MLGGPLLASEVMLTLLLWDDAGAVGVKGSSQQFRPAAGPATGTPDTEPSSSDTPGAALHRHTDGAGHSSGAAAPSAPQQGPGGVSARAPDSGRPHARPPRARAEVWATSYEPLATSASSSARCQLAVSRRYVRRPAAVASLLYGCQAVWT